jgi:site-specific DNA-methyltransferase (adenine-specific)
MANSEIIGAGQDTARRAPKTNTITCGDCLEVMQEIPDKSIDMILCDLPYGTTACKWDVVIPFSSLWQQYERVIKDKCVIVLMAGQPFTSALVTSNLKIFKYCWVWVKDKAANFGVAKYRPMNVTEDICVFYEGVSKYYSQKYDAGYKKNKPGKNSQYKGVYGQNGFKWSYDESTMQYPKNILFYSTPKHNDGINGAIHPTQKPVALFEYLIKTYTNPGDLVLDNCIGSGTTAIACLNTGRNFIGIEKEEKYCRIAEERIHALRSPAQNTMEICHTAPNSAMLQGLKPHAGNTGTSA